MWIKGGGFLSGALWDEERSQSISLSPTRAAWEHSAWVLARTWGGGQPQVGSQAPRLRTAQRREQLELCDIFERPHRMGPGLPKPQSFLSNINLTFGLDAVALDLATDGMFLAPQTVRSPTAEVACGSFQVPAEIGFEKGFLLAAFSSSFFVLIDVKRQPCLKKCNYSRGWLEVERKDR